MAVIDPVPAVPLAETLKEEQPMREEIVDKVVVEQEEVSTASSDEQPKHLKVGPPAVREEVEVTKAPIRDDQVIVEFIVLGGKKKEVEFTQRPLGLEFSNKIPMIVDQVVPGSHAASLGIEAGWEISKICGHEVRIADWKRLVADFHAKADLLPNRDDRAIIEFLAHDGSKQVIEFSKRPLGFEFANKRPMIVDKVLPQSHAANLGVQQGWEITRICGDEVSGKEWKKLVSDFHDKAGRLPQ